MTGVHIRKDTHKERKGGHLKMEAQIGVMQLQTKEHQGQSATMQSKEQTGKDFYLKNKGS